MHWSFRIYRVPLKNFNVEITSLEKQNWLFWLNKFSIQVLTFLRGTFYKCQRSSFGSSLWCKAQSSYPARLYKVTIIFILRERRAVTMIDDDARARELWVPSFWNNFAHQRALSRHGDPQTVPKWPESNFARGSPEKFPRGRSSSEPQTSPRPFIGGAQLGNMEIMLPISRHVMGRTRPTRHASFDEYGALSAAYIDNWRESPCTLII